MSHQRILWNRNINIKFNVLPQDTTEDTLPLDTEQNLPENLEFASKEQAKKSSIEDSKQEIETKQSEDQEAKLQEQQIAGFNLLKEILAKQQEQANNSLNDVQNSQQSLIATLQQEINQNSQLEGEIEQQKQDLLSKNINVNNLTQQIQEALNNQPPVVPQEEIEFQGQNNDNYMQTPQPQPMPYYNQGADDQDFVVQNNVNPNFIPDNNQFPMQSQLDYPYSEQNEPQFIPAQYNNGMHNLAFNQGQIASPYEENAPMLPMQSNSQPWIEQNINNFNQNQEIDPWEVERNQQQPSFRPNADIYYEEGVTLEYFYRMLDYLRSKDIIIAPLLYKYKYFKTDIILVQSPMLQQHSDNSILLTPNKKEVWYKLKQMLLMHRGKAI